MLLCAEMLLWAAVVLTSTLLELNWIELKLPRGGGGTMANFEYNITEIPEGHTKNSKLKIM